MDFIENWKQKSYICSKCRTSKSVKWKYDNKVYCNICSITEVLLPQDSVNQVYNEHFVN